MKLKVLLSVLLLAGALLVYEQSSLEAANVTVNGNNNAGDVIASTSLSSSGYTDVYVLRGFLPKGSTKSIDGLGISTTVAHIDTNVVVQLQGSMDGSNYFNLRAARNALTASVDTLTANGTYYTYIDGISSVRYIRGRFVSEKGDSTVTVLIQWLFGE